MSRLGTGLYFCTFTFLLAIGFDMPPDPPQLQQILTEAGYTNWTEANSAEQQRSHPTMSQFVQEAWTVMRHKGGRWNCSGSSVRPPHLEFFFIPSDALFFALVFMGSSLLVWLRLRVTPPIIRWALSCGLKPNDAVKTPESVWKGASHGFLWLASFYVVIYSGRYRFFHKPCSVWDNIIWNDHIGDEPIPMDLRFIYGLQMIHYFHAFYATLRFEAKRADYMALIVHHFVTLSLLVFSYLIRFFQIGALVLFLHDVSDVLLEMTKLNVYFRHRNGVLRKFNKYMGDIGFIAFTISWALCRLYWYPVKVLHACTWCPIIRHGCVDRLLFWPANILLWVLQFLHIYWFGFILLLVYKILTGQIREVEDTRETDADQVDMNGDALRTTYANSQNGLQNGYYCNNNTNENKNSHKKPPTAVLTKRTPIKQSK